MQNTTKKQYETRWIENGIQKSEEFDTPEQARSKMREIVATRVRRPDGSWDKEFLGVWNREDLAVRAERLAAERDPNRQEG